MDVIDFNQQAFNQQISGFYHRNTMKSWIFDGSVFFCGSARKKNRPFTKKYGSSHQITPTKIIENIDLTMI